MFCGVVIFPKIIVLPHVKNIVSRGQLLTEEDVFSANLYFFHFFFHFFFICFWKGAKSGLFYHYCRLFKEMGCQFFLLENVSRMKKFDLDGITTKLQMLTKRPVRRFLLNSADFSGQRRRRFFWTNVNNSSCVFLFCFLFLYSLFHNQ